MCVSGCLRYWPPCLWSPRLPKAGCFWNPANAASGAYTVKGTFTLLKPSSHPNYYGIVFGGSDLGGAAQAYLYFMVAQDGTWLLKHRQGAATPELGRGSSAVVKRPDATGKSVNALEVRVLADKIDYVVNGTVVHTTPKSGVTAKTDGLVVQGRLIRHKGISPARALRRKAELLPADAGPD